VTGLEINAKKTIDMPMSHQNIVRAIKASQRQCKHESRRISFVGNHYLAMPSEDIEDFMCAAAK
jgi:hypothetical protein